MKKILYGMMAATMIFATSCENELEVGAAGEESVVSFTIATPDMGSRAYSDGKTATQLQYAVYNSNGELLQDLTSEERGIVTMQDLGATVKLPLVTGNSYKVIFWAAAEDAPYTVTFANDIDDAKMEVSYDGVSNDEARDAFYKYHTFTVSGAQTETIELKRPFAQLNIGTKDYAEAEKAGYIPTQSAVTVKQVYTKLNLMDGTVDENSKVDAVFAENLIDRNQAFPVAGYEYLAMNYLLVDDDKETVEVEFTYTDGSNAKTRTVGSVPVQRNYRTNIYGELLTSQVDINVEIDHYYNEPDHGINNVVFSNVELQAALDAATTGTTTIYLGKDIEGDVFDFQKADRNIVIEGGNNKYNGTIKIHNGSKYNNGSIKIQNVAFETETASLNFIMPNDFGTENGITRRYSNNVIVENCTFAATGAAENTVVGVQANACKNLQIIGCTATGMHSLVQAQSCGDDVIVKDCTISGKNGVAFKQVKNAVVEGTEINAAAYGIRFDGNIDNYGITAKDINVTAVQPFIVRKMTGENNTIALEGANTLTTSEEYQIVITNGSDDQAYVAPTGSYTLTGADNFEVYPRDAFDFTEVSSADQLISAFTDMSVSSIKASADIILSQRFSADNRGELALDMGEYSLSGSDYLGQITNDTQLTIENGNFAGGFQVAYGASLTFNNGKINVTSTSTSGRYCLYAVSNAELVINGGEFSFPNLALKRQYIYVSGNSVAYVKGGTFGNPSTREGYKTPFYVSDGGKVIVTGGTFGFDPSAWVADGYKAEKIGSTWTVSAE